MTKMTLFAALALSVTMFGEDTQSIMNKHWAVSRDFTLAVADAMPADQYGFRPNAEEMSFGQLMVHIAVANNAAFATVAGEKPPALPESLAKWRDTPNIDKATAIKFMTDSFDYCLKKMSSLDTSVLEAESGPEGRKLIGYERIWSYFTHTAHHRGQAEVYLRVKNIKPPAYKF